jgi:hypothetical protein
MLHIQDKGKLAVSERFWETTQAKRKPVPSLGSKSAELVMRYPYSYQTMQVYQRKYRGANATHGAGCISVWGQKSNHRGAEAQREKI